MNVEQPGASAFTELSDVPNSYVGAGGKIVSVEVAETGLEFITGGPGGGATWGSITGTLSAQTDLQTALDGKVDENVAITGSTNTKITYDAKGLVTAGAAATTADINDSTNRRYVTDAQLVVIGNTSGTNTGNQTSIVGITGSLAEFNTALTGADFATGGGTVTGASSGTNTGDQTSIVGITGTIAQFNTALTDGDFATGGGTAAGTNTGDNATNTQYSGLATSKQDTLVSGTNIKTVNSNSLLGSGDVAITGTTNLSYTAATRVIASDTGTDATLPLMSSGDAGLVPASGGGTTNFLRADGTFAAPTASATITTQEEGVTLSSTVTTLNFVGAGVTAAGAGATTTITIPGGGGGLTIGLATALANGFTSI